MLCQAIIPQYCPEMKPGFPITFPFFLYCGAFLFFQSLGLLKAIHAMIRITKDSMPQLIKQ